MDTQQHDDRVREQFARQAGTFGDTGFASRGLQWIVDLLAPASTDTVLDVAAGAGHLGRAIAPAVRHVSLLDLTPDMLRRGDAFARRDGQRNVSFQVGNAVALPWLDGQFDLVVCRLTLHQVADPAAVVAEMARVARPGGRVAVIDMIADPDPAVAQETNRLERLRDPSHGTTLTRDGIVGLLADAGLRIELDETTQQRLDLADWLERTGTPDADRQHIRARFEAELAGGTPTGLRPVRDEHGELGFTHDWGALVGRSPGDPAR